MRRRIAASATSFSGSIVMVKPSRATRGRARSGRILPRHGSAPAMRVSSSSATTKRYVADQYPLSGHPLWRGEEYSHDRIRLGYLSSDFHDHATAWLMAGLFERHDRSRFETTALSFGPAVDSDMRQRLQRAFDRFVDVRAQTDQEIAGL